MNFVLSHQRNSQNNNNMDVGPAQQDAFEIDRLLQTPNMLPTTAQFILGEISYYDVMILHHVVLFQ